MTTYTHTYEMKFADDSELSGEIQLNSSGKACFCSSGSEELTLDQHRAVQQLFDTVANFNQMFPGFKKIEFVIKT